MKNLKALILENILTTKECKAITNQALSDMPFFVDLKPNLINKNDMYKIVQNKFSKLFYLIVYVNFEYQLWAKYGVLSGTTPIKKLNSTKTTYDILNNNKIQLFYFNVGFQNIKTKLTSEENFKSKEEFLKEYEIADWAKSEILTKTNDKTGLFNA